MAVSSIGSTIGILEDDRQHILGKGISCDRDDCRSGHAFAVVAVAAAAA